MITIWWAELNLCRHVPRDLMSRRSKCVRFVYAIACMGGRGWQQGRVAVSRQKGSCKSEEDRLNIQFRILIKNKIAFRRCGNFYFILKCWNSCSIYMAGYILSTNFLRIGTEKKKKNLSRYKTSKYIFCEKPNKTIKHNETKQREIPRTSSKPVHVWNVEDMVGISIWHWLEAKC